MPPIVAELILLLKETYDLRGIVIVGVDHVNEDMLAARKKHKVGESDMGP